MSDRSRIEEIEERKIEILQEVSSLNEDYRDRMDLLNKEYEILNRELYDLKIELISKK